MTIVLAKDATAKHLINYCACEGLAIASAFDQWDSPWRGTGWLFTCIDCCKAFTIATVVDASESYENLAQRALRRFFVGGPPVDHLVPWYVEEMKLLETLELGEQYAYFDGLAVRVKDGCVYGDGIKRPHDLPFVPQIEALEDPTIKEQILCNQWYWILPDPCRID